MKDDNVAGAAKRYAAFLDGQSIYTEEEDAVDQVDKDARILARAYLNHQPLTRDRVAAAVRELMEGIRGATGGHEPFDRVWLTDRLCHLLGVEDK